MGIWALIKLFIWGPIKNFLKYLLANPKALVALIVAIAIMWGYWKVDNHIDGLNDQITGLQKEKAELIQTVEVLKNDIKVAKQVNVENQQVLETLKADLTTTKELFQAARDKAAAHKKKLDELEARLKDLQDGPVAEVLRETIKDIQLQRDIKEQQ